jgi:2-C-methyl-D-erythritol 2,4-cyclodiphosphate synthase
MYRVGIGYDSHRFREGRKLIIGGVEIPFEKGLAGYSDADVLCHSIIDAILGGLGLGDIGQHFPDTDEKWKDASSLELLKYIVELARINGFDITWIDASVIAERPKLGAYFDKIKKMLSETGIPSGFINLKAKTNEGMGFIGRNEGIAAISVCTLKKLQ